MSAGLSTFLLMLLAALLLACCWFDWRSRTIPNGLNAAIALLAIPFWWAAGLALWLPWQALLAMLFVMSVAGGVLTLGFLVASRIAGRKDRPEIPYGLAIAFGGLWVLSERFLYQFG